MMETFIVIWLGLGGVIAFVCLLAALGLYFIEDDERGSQKAAMFFVLSPLWPLAIPFLVLFLFKWAGDGFLLTLKEYRS